MNRRSVLSMLGIGAAAGPAVVAKAASEYAQSPKLSTIPGPSIQWDGDKKIIWKPENELAEIKKTYDVMVSDRSAWVADYIAREYEEIRGGYTSAYRYENIDPDIRNMKSLSESAKIRMAVERRANNRYDYMKKSLFSQIQSMMEQM